MPCEAGPGDPIAFGQKPSLLQSCRIEDVIPAAIAFVDEFVTGDAEERLLREVRASKAKWTTLSGRRLQNHGGVVHSKGLIPAPLPSWLQPLLDRLHREAGDLYGGAPPNHVLINAYQPGEGIMPHEDGPAYFPGVAILSLGAPAVLRFWRKRGAGTEPAASTDPAAAAAGGSQASASTDTSGSGQGASASGIGGAGSVARGQPADASLLLPPRSLVAFWSEAYAGSLHGILEVEREELDASVCNLHAISAEAATRLHIIPAPAEAAGPSSKERAAQQQEQEHGGAGSLEARQEQEGEEGPSATGAAAGAREQGAAPGAANQGAGAGPCGPSNAAPAVGAGSGRDGGSNSSSSAPSPRLQHGAFVERGGERVSFTVRRVTRVLPAGLLGALAGGRR